MPAIPSRPTTAPIACARAIWFRRFSRCPPARCPVSCAMTPMTSFGVLASSSVPVWMTMRRPLATKALNSPILDDDDLRVARADAGGAEDRLGIVAQQLLDLRVADDGLMALLRRGRRRERQARGDEVEERSCAAGSENAGRHDRYPICQTDARLIPARLNLARMRQAAARCGCLAKPRDERKASYVDGRMLKASATEPGRAVPRHGRARRGGRTGGGRPAASSTWRSDSPARRRRRRCSAPRPRP